MTGKRTPLEKEWLKFTKQEQAFAERHREKRESRLNRTLENKVPEKLQGTLDTAFAKAFALIFDKGTGVIEKTYQKEKLEQDYRINEYAAGVRQNRKALKAFSRKAGKAGTVNLLMSGVSGVGLGVLGIGLPDIVLFTGMMLKGIYETALNYGYTYESAQERQFILRLIHGAVSYGEEFLEEEEALNHYIQCGTFPTAETEELINRAARGLSGELLYMKFLQGIPVVGAVGGAYDAVYMRQIMTYAELKYRRRFLQKAFTAS